MAGTENTAPVLFFDRDVGTALPRALTVLALPTRVEFLQDHFPANTQDDVWMPVVGSRGWILIGHDRMHHRRAPERSAIQDHDMGCFYIWGAQARRWEKMRCSLNAYERILDAIETTTKPFIYRVNRFSTLVLQRRFLILVCFRSGTASRKARPQSC